MRAIFSIIAIAHGLIHLMGFAKAFGYAELPQLTQSISRAVGVLWLIAALATLAAVATLWLQPRVFWMTAAFALLASQAVIFSSFQDAKFGTLANVVMLLAAVHGYTSAGPGSFSAEFTRAAERRSVRGAGSATVTATDLVRLPPPVRRYLHATGFVGAPAIRAYRIHFRGRIRAEPTDDWMPFEARQQSFVAPHQRLFLMRATKLGLPVEAFHRLEGGHATMRVRAPLGIPIVDARGAEMDRSESVTLLNDLCILAPGGLLDPDITWEAMDDHHARARFTHGDQTVEAILVFDDEGLLVDFVSDDRSRSSADGKRFTPLRFSTPIGAYRTYGRFRLASRGEARWHLPSGSFAYGEFEMVDVAFDTE